MGTKSQLVWRGLYFFTILSFSYVPPTWCGSPVLCSWLLLLETTVLGELLLHRFVVLAMEVQEV